jgi:hypothetical protein
MAVFSLSDLIIAGTLFINAAALISKKPKNKFADSPDMSSSNCIDQHDDEESDERQNLVSKGVGVDKDNGGRVEDLQRVVPPSIPGTHNTPSTNSFIGFFSNLTTGISSILDLLSQSLFRVRKFSCIIVIWNIIFLILILFVFNS